MVYDRMSSTAQGDVQFYLGDDLVAVLGYYYALGDYVYICEVDGQIVSFFLRINYTSTDVEQRRNEVATVIKAYLLHLLGKTEFNCNILISGIIKINQDPLSLTHYITVNSSVIALVLNPNGIAAGEGITTVGLASKDGSYYGVDVMNDKLINVVASKQPQLEDLSMWLSVSYENWRMKNAPKKARQATCT